MQWNFFVSAFVLATGVSTSIYLLAMWFRHAVPRPRFLVLWAAALFLHYWFQVPAILVGWGRQITVTNFNLFFAITLPITFVALVLLYAGLLEIFGMRPAPRAKRLFYGWVIGAFVFFAWYFIRHGGVIETYSMPIVGNLAFYLPIRILIFVPLVRWLFRPGPKTAGVALGAAALGGANLLGLVRNILVVRTVLAYPPDFWYVALGALRIFSILQTLGIILTIVGFYFLCRSWRRHHESGVV